MLKTNKTTEVKRTIWNSQFHAKKAGVISSVLSLKAKARLAKNDEGKPIFSKNDLDLIEPIFQKMKEICLNCID